MPRAKDAVANLAVKDLKVPRGPMRSPWVSSLSALRVTK